MIDRRGIKSFDFIADPVARPPQVGGVNSVAVGRQQRGRYSGHGILGGVCPMFFRQFTLSNYCLPTTGRF